MRWPVLLSSIHVFLLTIGSVALAGEQPTEPKAPQPAEATQALLKDGDRLLTEAKAAEALGVAQRALAAADQANDTSGQALAQKLRARSLDALARPDEAKAAWQEASALWESLRARPEQIEALCAQVLDLGRDDPASAAPLEEKALRLASDEKARPLAAASALNAAADRARRTQRLDIAGRLATEALAITEKKAPGSLDVATSLNNLGIVATIKGDTDAAQDLLERSLEIRQKLAPGSLDVAGSLSSLGNVALSRGNLDTALDYYQRALALRETLAPGSLDVATSLSNLGNVAITRGDLDAARDFHQRSLAIREKLAPGSLDLAASLTNIGVVALDRGELDASRGYLQRALTILERLAPGSLPLASALSNLGNLAVNGGDLDAGWDYFQRALTIEERLVPGSLNVTNALTGLGEVARLRGDLVSAQDYQERALAGKERLAPGSIGVSYNLNDLGAIALHRGDLDAARDYFQRALTIQEKLGPGSLDVAASLNNLGDVANDRGDLDAARDYFQRALTIQEKLGPGSLDAAASLGNLGRISRERGDLDAARDYQQRALAIREKLAPGSTDVAATLDDLGSVAENRGELDTARDYGQRALAIQERLGPGSLAMTEILSGLGNILREQGHLATSEEYFARAWAIVREQWRVVVGDEAARAFGARRAEVAVNLVRVRLTLHESAAAFQALEEGRAQGLLTLLSERGLPPTGSDQDLRRKFLTAEGAFQKAAAQLAAASDREAQLEQEIKEHAGSSGERETFETKQGELAESGKNREAALSSYTQARLEKDRLLAEIRRSLSLEPRSFTFDEARRALPRGSVFLAWMVGQHESTGFVIPADTKLAVEPYTIALGEEQLAKRVGKLRERIGEGAQVRGIGGLTESSQWSSLDASLIAASRELFEALFPPAARVAVEKADRVIVSPDGPLWDLPFAALVMNSSGEPRWLGIEKRLSYTPSLTVLAQERGRAPAAVAGKQEILIVGDPVLVRVPTPGAGAVVSVVAVEPAHAPTVRGERSSLVPGGQLPDRLPAAGDEARQVAALYGTDALLGEAATEAAVRQRISRAAVVHLATHGYFNPHLAMSSGLLLTPPEGEPGIDETDNDGALQAWEFGRTLPLSADLVVLSACETGRGEKVRAEGLVGLTRAIQAAGARTVVATQWKVADESTAMLMVSFHKRLRKGLARDEALRKAMAESASAPATRHPYFWGGFFLTGDPDSPLRLPSAR